MNREGFFPGCYFLSDTISLEQSCALPAQLCSGYPARAQKSLRASQGPDPTLCPPGLGRTNVGIQLCGRGPGSPRSQGTVDSPELERYGVSREREVEVGDRRKRLPEAGGKDWC